MSVLAKRDRAFEVLERGPLDVLVIGGGIVGTGIARDLALRGLKVALVERHDLASGTSSRPTRLIHGGLRYLEIFDFALVRTDMREREVLLRVAPHLVHPLRFLLPITGRGLLYRARLQAGMQLYDALSFDKSLPTRRWLSRAEVQRAEPGLNPTDLQGAWQFYDGQVPLVERLVLENALDAASQGGIVLTYASATRFLLDQGGNVTGAVVRDALSGREVAARARVTVNATGPWLDTTTADLRPGRRPLLRLTKGVHIVTPSASQHAHVLFARHDGRLFFVVPWLGYSLVGTTDTDYRGDPTDAAASAEDVEYLIAEARHAFPGGRFDEVHYAWAGVRALVRVENVNEGQVSRKHALHDHARGEGVHGIVSVVGGKLTGYRAIAEDVGDLVVGKLGRLDRNVSRATRVRPLPGGHLANLQTYVRDEVWPRARAVGLDLEQASHLGSMYGSLSPAVLARVERDPRLARRVCPHQPTIAAQLECAVVDEWAVCLADVLLRRTSLGLQACQALDCLDAVAEYLAGLLGWDAAERARQIEAYRREIEPMRRFSRATAPAA
ncbi:MAG: glycerol-3-phosphate dehydrogenase/oxidase [Chloroflexota bacterium]|nr:glycerol-3-phosphate dehydrogenase/oxidase [Chloroflexota bacterium]